jgi:hypothetical protein
MQKWLEKALGNAQVVAHERFARVHQHRVPLRGRHVLEIHPVSRGKVTLAHESIGQGSQ